MLQMFFVICAAGGGALVVAQALLSALALGVHHGPHVHHNSGGRGGWTHRAGRASRWTRSAGRGRGVQHRVRGPVVKAAPAAHAPQAQLSPHAKAVAAIAARSQQAQRHSNLSAASHDSLTWLWLHSLFNFQGLVAGATVLGLAGLAASAGGLPGAAVLAIAVGSGFAMMVVIAAIFAAMVNMDEDGTVQMDHAIGAIGTVYLGIPANQSGRGKVMATVQGRTLELAAVTFEDRALERGEPVMVVAVQDNGVVEVVSGEKYLPDLLPAGSV